MKRSMLVATTAALISILAAAPASAHQCINASKANPAAGAQVLFGPDDQPISFTKGLEKRIEQGLVDPATGEGSHGVMAFDVNGDGEADVSAWAGVGPDGEIPLTAQFRGPACRGLTNVGVYLEQCLET